MEAGPTTALLEVGPSAAPIREPVLVDLMIWKIVDRVMARATKAAGKGKTVRKVVPSILALLERPRYQISLDVAKELIKGA